MSKKTLWATFIGINAYPQNELNGCIKDVLDTDVLLREQSRQQASPLRYAPFYLLAPNGVDALRIRDYEAAQGITISVEAPTFANVSQKAFAHLKQAQPGDTCVFFYSGHGSQIEAPEVFWHTKPDRQNETIVCVDSRDPAHPEARDLIDKELGFLLWDALDGKDVHCLVIMDCCHSGNNTRAALETTGMRFRYESPSGTKVPLEHYLGYDSGFYEIQNNSASIKVARYVHLAAARDNEKAQETMEGGLFTTKLMEVLRTGGTAKSYRVLAQELAISVRLRADQQHPVAFAREDSDLDLQFLGGGIVPYKPSYEVRYDAVQGQWMLYGGALHGLTPPVADDYTIVQITGTGIKAKLQHVFATTSVLDENDLSGLDADKSYNAVLSRLAIPVLKIGLSKGLLAEPAKLQALTLAYDTATHLYYTIRFQEDATSDYLIQLTQNDQYALTKKGSDVPLFKREANAGSFLQKLDVVGKWISTVNLKNTNTSYLNTDFIFTLERIEGVLIPERNYDTVPGIPEIIQPDETVLLSYKNGFAPGFRLQITIHPASPLKSCFVGALYMDSKFGIDPELIKNDANELKNEVGSAIHIGSFSGGRFYKTLPLDFDEQYSRNGIDEIVDYVKLFVSNDKEMDLKRFQQESLPLDEPPETGFRGRRETRRGNGADQDWTVFTIPIRIVGPNKEKILKPGTVPFSSFAMEVPDGFEAAAFAAIGEDLKGNVPMAATRSANGNEASAVEKPPGSIWGEAITESSVFTKAGSNVGGDAGVQALELTSVKGGDLEIPPGATLRIIPDAASATARSLDKGPEHTVVPYGYDPETGLYFPVGVADENGVIHIQQLPPATAGRLKESNAQTRSLQGSVKLFFKKIIKPNEVARLALYAVEPEGSWKQVTDKPPEIKDHLNATTSSGIVLLLHGIMGDTRYMMEALKGMEKWPTHIKYVLTYDYETLATSVSKTADALKDNLTAAGLGEGANGGITIVAHSTGGLVARWLIEKSRGPHVVKHLIMAGTPNGGTELSKLSTSVFGLLTHALNVTGPIKYAITGLSFLLKKLQLDPTRFLRDIEPDSPLLQELKESKAPDGVRYSIVGGDMGLLKSYDGDDFFFKKLATALTKNIIRPGLNHLFDSKANDMAVTLNSMKAVPGFDETSLHTVAADHLAYFKEKGSLEKIAALLH